MNSRFRLYGKEFIKWAKIEKAKNAARVSAREKTVSSPQDIQPRTVPDGRSTLIDTLPEARNWLADAQYEDKHDVYNPSSEMTVDAWFEFWIANLIADLAPNTRRNYRERYERNIQPVIGSMRLCDVKPMHCKIVLNRMEATYAGSTIRQAYIAMGTIEHQNHHGSLCPCYRCLPYQCRKTV